MAFAATATLVAPQRARADDTFAMRADEAGTEEASTEGEPTSVEPRPAVEPDLGPDGKTRPVPALIAGGLVLNLAGAAGLVASSFGLLLSSPDDTRALAGGVVGVALSFIALGGGTAMMILGSPRRPTSTTQVIVYPSGASLRWSL